MVGAPLAVIVGKIVPQPGAHDSPPCVSSQVTPRPDVSFATVAVNCCTPPSASEADVGETVTATPLVLLELPPPHPTLKPSARNREIFQKVRSEPKCCPKDFTRFACLRETKMPDNQGPITTERPLYE